MEAIKFLNQELSWDSLDKKLKDLTTSKQTKKAGDIFETVVKYYLLTNSKYKSTLINIWLLDEVPALVKLKLNLPNNDEGIDLIAETKTGHFWAIQAKYRSDPNETLTIGGKGSLATFNNLAFGYCKNISHGLVLATVSKPPKKIKLINHIGFETLESFLSLDDNDKEEWKALLAASLGKIIKPKKLEPRPHQVEAIKKALKYFKTNQRGKMIMPCGTGKSLAAFWIAKEMKAKSILIAVPSLALLQQTLKVWTREFLINDINPDWLCVCSDDTVKEDQDSFISYTYDLGVEVTTEIEKIKNFLDKTSATVKIVFTTYQSGKALAQAAKGFAFDLGIMDEAHKTVGHSEKAMAHLIYEKNVKIKNRLFMTATERLFRIDSDEFLSMDKEKDYGKIIYELSFKEAIFCKPPIISDYKIITYNVSEHEIEQLHNDNKFLKIEEKIKDMTAREFATAIALRKAIKKYDIKNAISFHRSIKRANNFKIQQDLISEIYPEYENLKTFHISSKMSVSERNSQIRLFIEHKGLITNARCLTEGVDLPAVDCVCFADPKRSKVDIVQAAGRALRLSPGKKFGYILVPIFVPNDQNPETASKDSEFEEVIAVIGHLSTQDSRIADYLKITSAGGKPSHGSPVDGIVNINELTEVDAQKFNQSIQIKIWDKIGKINYLQYRDAKKYVQSLRIKTMERWHSYFKTNKKPPDIPLNPQLYYKNDWESWGVFLGSGNVSNSKKFFKNYIEAKKIAQSLNIKFRKDWEKLSSDKKLPKDLPQSPQDVYTNEWEGWGKFLGNNRKYTARSKFTNHEKNEQDNLKIDTINVIKKNSRHAFMKSINFRDYEEAKKYAQSLNLKSSRDWYKLVKFKKLPNDIPINPNRFKNYKNQWKGWGEFLSTNNISRKNINFRDYEEAKKYAQSLNLKTSHEWLKLVSLKKIPEDIPGSPYKLKKYKNQWKGWGEFLGHKRKSRIDVNYKDYEEAKKYVQSLNLKSSHEWLKLVLLKKIPNDIPTNPNLFKRYRNKWEGWDEFLGINKIFN